MPGRRICATAGVMASSRRHPVFIALRETVRAKHTPLRLYLDLLRAFRQDQKVQRYATWDDVLGYCVYSANPVGRLVLHLCDYRDEERQRLSDFTCTALQLANFWQDVSRDLEKGRIYIPLEELAKHGLTEADIVARRFDARYVALMKSLIARTRELFDAGLPWPIASMAACVRTSNFSAAVEWLSWMPSKHPDTTRSRTARRCRNGPRSNCSAERSARERLRVRLGRQKKRSLAPASSVPRDAGLAGSSVGVVARESHDVAASYAECNRIARAARSSFYLAFFGLRKEKRNALCALYAFMRLVDDVSDEPGDVESKRRGLARWRALLDEAAAGHTEGHADSSRARRHDRAL